MWRSPRRTPRRSDPSPSIPIGSGNDFAHTLKAEPDAAALAQAIVSARSRFVDLGLATLRGPSGELRRYFHNSLGFGLEASVTQESDRIRNLSGGLLYLAAAFRALRSYDTPQTTIEWLDEQGAPQRIEQEITLVSIGNAKRTGGAFYLTPAAEIDDELFDVALAGAMSRARLLVLLPRALVGKHTGGLRAHAALPADSGAQPYAAARAHGRRGGDGGRARRRSGRPSRTATDRRLARRPPAPLGAPAARESARPITVLPRTRHTPESGAGFSASVKFWYTHRRVWNPCERTRTRMGFFHCTCLDPSGSDPTNPFRTVRQ